MQLIKLPPLSEFGVNSYIIVSDKGNGVLIDAPYGGSYILNVLKEKDISLKKLLLTHGHCDHIASAAEIIKATGAEVYIHQADSSKLTNGRTNLTEYFHLPPIDPVFDPVIIHDGDIITQDELSFEVLHTPGHTSGSVCYLLGEDMFCGDTLFRGSMGRVDMIDGNYAVMKRSLAMLAEYTGKFSDYNVYSGHGMSSTLSFEKASNPYLKGAFDDNGDI
ncbi:MAG: MBL fold metallo-hydrolase [Huintestinicola sp.]